MTPEQIIASNVAQALVSRRQTLAALGAAHQAGIDQGAPAQQLFEVAQRIHALEAEIAQLEAQLRALLPGMFPLE